MQGRRQLTNVNIGTTTFNKRKELHSTCLVCLKRYKQLVLVRSSECKIWCPQMHQMFFGTSLSLTNPHPHNLWPQPSPYPLLYTTFVWMRLATGRYVTVEKRQHSAADVCFVKTLLLPDLILTMSKPSHNYLAPSGGQWEGSAPGKAKGCKIGVGGPLPDTHS